MARNNKSSNKTSEDTRSSQRSSNSSGTQGPTEAPEHDRAPHLPYCFLSQHVERSGCIPILWYKSHDGDWLSLNT